MSWFTEHQGQQAKATAVSCFQFNTEFFKGDFGAQNGHFKSETGHFKSENGHFKSLSSLGQKRFACGALFIHF